MELFKNNIKKKVLCIFSHREDHIVCGWPIIQNPIPEKYLFVCTNDAIDLTVKSCKIAGINFMGSAHLENSFGYPNRNIDIEKHRLTNSNYTKLKDIFVNIIEEVKPDIIFTHNPMGEYGHLDHKLVFEIIYNEFSLPIIITDITAKSSYYHYYPEVPKIYNNLYSNFESLVQPDYVFYSKHSKIFSEYNMWTENENLNIPNYPKRTRLYWLNNE